MQGSSQPNEITRLREHIAQEYQAAQFGLTGLAQGTSKHTFITRKMERLGAYHSQLAALVGEQEAMRTICAILEEHGGA